MAGRCIRIRSEIDRISGSIDCMSLVDEYGTEYTIDSLFRVLYESSRRVVDEVYREEHDGTGKSRD